MSNMSQKLDIIGENQITTHQRNFLQNRKNSVTRFLKNRIIHPNAFFIGFTLIITYIVGYHEMLMGQIQA